MSLVARVVETGELIASTDAHASFTSVHCPDAKCGAKVHYVRPLTDSESGDVVRTAFFRHSVGSGCPHGSSTGGDSMTPWHVTWQMRCDDLARLEVVVERGDAKSRADTLAKDGTTAIEYQNSGLSQAAITRRENIWRGRVIWVLNSGSDDRAGEATLSDRFRWFSTVGLQRRLFRGVVLIDIGGGRLVELPRTGTLPVASLLDIPATAVRVWSCEEFVAEVVNGDEIPFDLNATQWAVEARAKAAEQQRRRRSDAERAEARDKARQAKIARQMTEGYACEYTGNHRDLLIAPDAVEGVDAGAEVTVVKARAWQGYPCRGCGELGQDKAASWCDRCWQSRIEVAAVTSRCAACNLPCTASLCWACQRGIRRGA